MCLAVPGKLIEIISAQEEVFPTGKVSFDGVVKKVSLALIPEVKINDYVMVHVGAAISIIDRDEAEKTLEILRQLGEIDDIT
ncbi:HypC/HybG/HupF family hydrogenase formation chaperone [Abyssalbus ytuae]|uniref:HypC/HybG/HupF family hydrogenase formation chaperone n=1 Tax=Abyssalbus ytuae TaxID=2926907 RepID=A0A9E6ZMQ6_9FLAO|nr:HypC/HybG/HupF family hydrogenase formation chaperone [Abyssalbus ytuae]UOB17100.1 HypC/HybG/HupF family hydrogenase formation chaperone [Abyssalbus ytuae]